MCVYIYIYVCICIFCVLCPLVIPLQNPNVQFSLQLWAIVKDKEVWRDVVRGVTKAVQDLVTQWQCASAWQMFHLCWMIKSIIEKSKGGTNECWGSHGKWMVAQANQWYWQPSKHSREIPSWAAATAWSLQWCPTLCGNAALQASLSMIFSRQESWRGLPCSPGDLSTQGSNPGRLHCRQILYQWATREAPSLDNMDKQADVWSSSWARILAGRWSASRTFNKHSCK